MKFLVDENLPEEAAEKLRAAGHEAVSVPARKLSGSSDATVAALCKAEQRALLTLDGDFGNTLCYPQAEFFGLVVLRLLPQDKHSVLRVLDLLIPKLHEEELRGKLWVVDEERIRIR